MLATLAVAVAPAASASAAAWTCEASAVSASVLGGAAIEPAQANVGRSDCRSANATLATPLPLPLDAAAVVASTTLSGPADRVDLQQAVAAGGIADLRVRALGGLPIQLPAVELPDYSALPVPLPDLLLLPDVVPVDIMPALQALVPQLQLPTADLLRVQGAVAYAGGQCVNGVPQLGGTSRVAGISALGAELPVGQVVDRTLTLLDSGSIDPSNIDLDLVALPDVLGLTRDILEPALQQVLDTLPTIAIPATLAQVKVQPGGQTATGDTLTQRALRVQVAIAGQPVADLAIGKATAGKAGVSCALPDGAAPVSEAEAALQCTTRRLVLTDVLRRGDRVKLVGAADRALAGRTVDIVFEATGRRVARARVGADGSFGTTAPLPRKGLLRSNRARYRAELGDEQSLNLKLARRMVVTRMTSAGGRVTIAGRVIGPLAEPVRSIAVRRRVSCSRSELVERIKPRRDGSFRVTVPAPPRQLAAVYRLSTRVRRTTRNPKTFPTYTLPRAVEIR